MTGTAWAAASGVGFGLFQSLNGRAARSLADPYLSTFAQLLLAGAILVAASVTTQDLGLLRHAPAAAFAAVAGAGVLHFIAGWTLLNLSQERLGAARTSPLIATTPLFTLALGVVIAGQYPGPAAIAAIAAMVGGVVLTAQTPGASVPLRTAAFGLGAAVCWASSPLLAVEGIHRLPSPLLCVTMGMLVAVLLYGVALIGRHRVVRRARGPRPAAAARSADRARDVAMAFKLAAGVLVGLATWLRWLALGDADAAVVMALSLLSVPVVLLVAPLVSGRGHEPVSARTWAGAALVAGGALILIGGS